MGQQDKGFNVSPNQPMSFGVPPPPTAITRVVGLLRSYSFGAFGLVALVLLLETFGPKDHRPSDIIGGFHGHTTQVTLDFERDAQRKTAEAMANAQAAAQAKWSMEVETARQQQDIILRSLEAKQQAANLADYACMSGPVAMAFFGNDAAEYARTVQQACALAAQLRREIVETQAEAARIGSAIMQRGGVPVAAPQ